MLGVTLVGLFLTPVFYVVIRRLTISEPLSDSRDAQESQDPQGVKL
jgi:hypothetical protein